MNVESNIQEIKQDLGAKTQLVAVSKYTTNEKIQEAYDSGQRDFGENKAQDLSAKREVFPEDVNWHFIGHLQRNKVKYIAEYIHLIHAVDSLKLLKEINKQALKHQRTISCLLQMHIAEEDTKFGMDRVEIEELITNPILAELENIEISGLMGMATYTDDENQIRKEFKSLKSLFDEIKENHESSRVKMRELSMGMSQDYKIAVQEGSTMVRIGTAVFK